ncbi:MAG: hypothetical protein WC150_06815 [Bacteroidia bacterium]
MKYLSHYLIIVSLAALSIYLFYEQQHKYAIYIAFAALLFLALLQFTIKPRERKIEEALNQLKEEKKLHQDLKVEHKEVKEQKLNISELKQMLDIGLIEVNTKLSRSWNNEFMENKRQLRFFGILNVDLIGRYGVELKEVKFKYVEEHNILYIANAVPRFLAFTKKKVTWKMAEILEFKKPLIGENYWRTDSDWHLKLSEMKEKIRLEIEAQLEKGPEELNWVITPLKKQIENSLEAIFGKSGCKVKIVDKEDSSFRLLNEI